MFCFSLFSQFSLHPVRTFLFFSVSSFFILQAKRTRPLRSKRKIVQHKKSQSTCARLRPIHKCSSVRFVVIVVADVVAILWLCLIRFCTIKIQRKNDNGTKRAPVQFTLAWCACLCECECECKCKRTLALCGVMPATDDIHVLLLLRIFRFLRFCGFSVARKSSLVSRRVSGLTHHSMCSL